MDTSAFKRSMAALLADLPEARRRVHGRAAAVVLAEAQERAPIDTGNLRGTGIVDADEGGGLVAFTAEYAAAQHEGLDFVHPQGGEAKYLENALAEVGEKALMDAAAAELRRLGR